MNTLFVLILTVHLNTGESLDAITGMYNSMKECMALMNPLMIFIKIIKLR